MSSKNRTFKTEHQREFIKIFDNFGYKYDRWKVWQDFLDVFAAALQMPFYREEAGERIKVVHERYGDDYLKLDQLSTIVINALTERYQYFLGEVFMSLEFGNKWTGQFFTPYHMCVMMAEIALGNKENLEAVCHKKNYITINDPCIGGGAMLIAACDVMRSKDFNFQHNALFTAQDIDIKCVNMAYIQLSLIGAPGVVIWGDSLKVECRKAWYTPVYFLNHWPEKLKSYQMIDSMRDLLTSAEATPEPTTIEVPKIEYHEAYKAQPQFAFDWGK